MIDDLRKQIDKIDIDLVHLLAKRMELSVEIGRLKKAGGEAVMQLTREAVILDKVKLLADTLGLSEDFVGDVYRTILQESRKVQESL